jgi:hypothetical protein
MPSRRSSRRTSSREHILGRVNNRYLVAKLAQPYSVTTVTTADINNVQTGLRQLRKLCQ